MQRIQRIYAERKTLLKSILRKLLHRVLRAVQIFSIWNTLTNRHS